MAVNNIHSAVIASSGKGGKKPETMNDASKEFEKIFVEQLFRNMFSTLNRSSLVKQSFQRRMFEEMLHREFADVYAENGGLGLSEALSAQLGDKLNTRRGDRPEGEKRFMEFKRDEQAGSIEINRRQEWSRIGGNPDGMKKIYGGEREAADVSEKR